MSDKPNCPKCNAAHKPLIKAWECGSDYFGVDGETTFTYRSTTCWEREIKQLRAENAELKNLIRNGEKEPS